MPEGALSRHDQDVGNAKMVQPTAFNFRFGSSFLADRTVVMMYLQDLIRTFPSEALPRGKARRRSPHY